MLKKLALVFTCLSFLFILATISLTYLYATPGPLEETTVVTIKKGSGFRGIIQQLEDEGVVHSQYLVGIPALVMNKQSKLKPGEYEFPAGITPREVTNMLATGRIVVHKLTIPEGLTVRQIIALVMAEPLLEGEVAELPKEGSLLPETYHFERGDTRQAVLQRMQEGMQNALVELWPARADGLPFTTAEQAVALASIVEKEARLEEERRHIASVYVNRLRKGIKLQADPTTMYAIELAEGKPMDRLLVRSDLLRDLPYNTYMREGLPPTAIANPGKASIEATLHPLQTEDVFFVARGDGGHYFAKTYKEHKANIEKYRQQRSDAYRPEATIDDAPTEVAQ